jgi:hypothetical protein
MDGVLGSCAGVVEAVGLLLAPPIPALFFERH